jgi:hypothetical protein
MEVYSGPSVPLAFTITAGVAVTSLLGFVYLPDPARGVLVYLIALFL